MKKIIYLLVVLSVLFLCCESQDINGVDTPTEQEIEFDGGYEMAPNAKPSTVPEFATNDVTDPTTGIDNVIEPPLAKQQSGWNFLEKPPRSWMNWLHRFTYLWIDYFNQFFSATHQFKINEIVEFDAASGVTIDGTNIKDGVITDDGAAGVGIEETNGDIIRTKIIDIGNWDMDTTSTVTIAHGLTRSKIRIVSAYIRSDETSKFDRMLLNSEGNENLGFVGTNINIGDTDIVLQRATDGIFDNTDYDATPFNRGWITIQYID